MRKKFLCAVLLFSILLGYVLYIHSFHRDVYTYDQSIYVIVEDINDYDLEYLKSLDYRYEKIQINLIPVDNFEQFVFHSNDLLAVENKLLSNKKVNSFIKEKLKNKFVYFLGQSNINTISNLLGETLTEKQNIFEAESDNVDSKIVPMNNNVCSVLKYSNNTEYKEMIEVNYIEGAPSPEELLIPCFNDSLEQNTNVPLSLDLRTSGSKSNWYLTNQTTGNPQTNYVQSTYKMYKEVNESDPDKDYFVFVTENHFSSHGRWMKVEHDSNNTKDTTALTAAPTNHSATTSWDVSFNDISFSYNGTKVKISLQRVNDCINSWVYSNENSTSSFSLEDTFYSLSEFSIPQDKSITLRCSIHALDTDIGKVNAAYSLTVK